MIAIVTIIYIVNDLQHHLEEDRRTCTSDLGPSTRFLCIVPWTLEPGPWTHDLGGTTLNLGTGPGRWTPDTGPWNLSLGIGSCTLDLAPRTSDRGPRTQILDLGPCSAVPRPVSFLASLLAPHSPHRTSQTSLSFNSVWAQVLHCSRPCVISPPW